MRLFSILNTSNNKLLVLARNRSVAESIAYQANHIHYMMFRKDRFGLDFYEISKPWGEKFSNCWTAILHAMERRIEGTVELKDGFIVIGEEVVDP